MQERGQVSGQAAMHRELRTIQTRDILRDISLERRAAARMAVQQCALRTRAKRIGWDEPGDGTEGAWTRWGVGPAVGEEKNNGSR